MNLWRNFFGWFQEFTVASGLICRPEETGEVVEGLDADAVGDLVAPVRRAPTNFVVIVQGPARFTHSRTQSATSAYNGPSSEAVGPRIGRSTGTKGVPRARSVNGWPVSQRRRNRARTLSGVDHPVTRPRRQRPDRPS